MLQEAEKNILAQKLLVYNAVGNAGSKERLEQIVSTWDRLLSLTYGVDVDKTPSITEQSMLAEYEKIKHLRPEFKISKDGKISIKGLDSFVTKT